MLYIAIASYFSAGFGFMLGMRGEGLCLQHDGKFFKDWHDAWVVPLGVVVWPAIVVSIVVCETSIADLSFRKRLSR